MCVIIIGCAANSIKAYRRYQDIDACSDIIAFNKTDKSTNYMLCYGYKDYRAKDYYISGEKEKYGQGIILNQTYKIQNICVVSIKRHTIKAVKDVMIMTL